MPGFSDPVRSAEELVDQARALVYETRSSLKDEPGYTAQVLVGLVLANRQLIQVCAQVAAALESNRDFASTEHNDELDQNRGRWHASNASSSLRDAILRLDNVEEDLISAHENSKQVIWDYPAQPELAELLPINPRLELDDEFADVTGRCDPAGPALN